MSSLTNKKRYIPINGVKVTAPGANLKIQASVDDGATIIEEQNVKVCQNAAIENFDYILNNSSAQISIRPVYIAVDETKSNYTATFINKTSITSLPNISDKSDEGFLDEITISESGYYYLKGNTKSSESNDMELQVIDKAISPNIIIASNQFTVADGDYCVDNIHAIIKETNAANDYLRTVRAMIRPGKTAILEVKEASSTSGDATILGSDATSKKISLTSDNANIVIRGKIVNPDLELWDATKLLQKFKVVSSVAITPAKDVLKGRKQKIFIASYQEASGGAVVELTNGTTTAKAHFENDLSNIGTAITTFNGYDYVNVVSEEASTDKDDVVELSTTSKDKNSTDETDFLIAKIGITEVKGLFKGSHEVYEKGYKCIDVNGKDDNAGRVYTNHAYSESGDVITPGAWTAGTEYVDFTVSIIPVEAVIESSIDKIIQWEVIDPDDPSDEGMHSEAALYIDPYGAEGDDNNGSHAFGDELGYASNEILEVDDETEIRNGISKNRFKPSKIGGDNYQVVIKDVYNNEIDRTGTFTVWKLRHLEVGKMAGCQDISTSPWNTINTYFETAFVEWDIIKKEDDLPDFDVNSSTDLQPYFDNKDDNGFNMLAFVNNVAKSTPKFEIYTPPFSGEWYIYDDGSNSNELDEYSGILGLPGNDTEEGLVNSFPNSIDIKIVRIKDNNNSLIKTFYAKATKNFLYLNSVEYNNTLGDESGVEYKSLADHGLTVEAGTKYKNVTLISESSELGVGYTPGFAWAPNKTAVIRKSGDVQSVVHELTHLLFMAHNVGYRSTDHISKGAMTYDIFWTRRDDNAGLLIKNNDEPSTGLSAPIIKSIREISLDEELK